MLTKKKVDERSLADYSCAPISFVPVHYSLHPVIFDQMLGFLQFTIKKSAVFSLLTNRYKLGFRFEDLSPPTYRLSQHEVKLVIEFQFLISMCNIFL